MKKKSMIQIPQDVFFELVKYFLLNEKTQEGYEKIKKEIEKKVIAVMKRNLYATQFNETLTEKEKEKAMQEYMKYINNPNIFS